MYPFIQDSAVRYLIEKYIDLIDGDTKSAVKLPKDLLETKSTKVFSVFLLQKIVDWEFSLHMVFTST